MRIVCSSCQRDTARKDGPKTPTGKAICQSCKDKIESNMLKKDNFNSRQATSALKHHPDKYANGVLARCAKD